MLKKLKDRLRNFFIIMIAVLIAAAVVPSNSSSKAGKTKETSKMSDSIEQTAKPETDSKDIKDNSSASTGADAELPLVIDTLESNAANKELVIRYVDDEVSNNFLNMLVETSGIELTSDNIRTDAPNSFDYMIHFGDAGLLICHITYMADELSIRLQHTQDDICIVDYYTTIIHEYCPDISEDELQAGIVGLRNKEYDAYGANLYFEDIRTCYYSFKLNNSDEECYVIDMYIPSEYINKWVENDTKD